MATSDLFSELSKDSFKPDSESERRICAGILKLINDQASEVQSIAVKCLSPLVHKVKLPKTYLSIYVVNYPQ